MGTSRGSKTPQNRRTTVACTRILEQNWVPSIFLDFPVQELYIPEKYTYGYSYSYRLPPDPFFTKPLSAKSN